MGNCYEDAHQIAGDHNPKQVIIEQGNESIYNSTIISQLRSLPPISKIILNRIEEFGPFLPTGYKDFGPIYQFKNKTVYQGRLKNKLFSGLGRLILSDGTVIESQFQNGEPKNKTRIFKPSGDYFIGTIPEIDKSYLGMVHQKGITYEGQLLNHKPHGQGKQYSKSYSFVGKFQNGRKVQGSFQWNLDNTKNLQSYQGRFEHNLFEGVGTLINNTGKYVGNFESGVKQGYGEFTYPSGKTYKGMFKRNRQDGEGKIYDSDGHLFQEGIWANGKKINS